MLDLYAICDECERPFRWCECLTGDLHLPDSCDRAAVTAYGTQWLEAVGDTAENRQMFNRLYARWWARRARRAAGGV